MGLALAVAIMLFTGAPLVFAASGSIGVIPAYPQKGNQRTKAIFIHTLKGGESAEDGVRVFNYTDEERTVVLDAVDSIAASDGSFSCKQNSEKKQDVGTWVKMDESKVIIPAKSNVVVNFSVAVPPGTDPGEYDGCITAQDTKNFAPTSGQGVLLGFRNAIRLAITVPGKIVKKLSYERIDIAQNDKGNYTVSPVLKNEGNVSLDVTTRVQLKSVFGTKTPIKSANYPIIRGATTGWPFEFQRPFWGGIYKAYTSVSYNANPNDGLGVNTADQQKLREDTDYFVMMPAPQALMVMIGVPILLLVILATVLHRRHRRKKISKKWQKYTVQEGDSITAIASTYGLRWKRLAKVNNVKPPYLLKQGMVLLVPLETASQKKKRRGRGKWEIDQPAEAVADVQTQSAPASEATPAPAPTAQTSNQQRHDAQPMQQSPPQNAWPVPSAPTTNDWQSTLTDTDGDIDDGPDWREGASAAELRALGVLQDSSQVPQFSNSWNIDSSNEQIKTPKQRKTTTKRAAPTKSKPKPNKKTK